jgi:hypothetical protein
MIDKSKPGLWVYPDGREVIQRGAAGRKILNRRWNVAWNDAYGICCLCGDPVRLCDATLEHLKAKGAGGSKHDDRQENLSISHRAGNIRRGSMSLEKYFQFSQEERIAFCQGTVPPKKLGKSNICRVCGSPCDYRNNICQKCSTEERTRPLSERILCKCKLDSLTGCWNFTGSIINSGYGRISERGKYLTANRASWQAFRGTIPIGLCVLHRCDNKICVNPDHLFLGDQKDNMQDMLLKGRNNPAKTLPGRWGQKHPLARISDKQVQQIIERARKGENKGELAKEFGLSLVYLRAVCAGRKRKHG